MNEYELNKIIEFIEKIEWAHVCRSDAKYNFLTGDYYNSIQDLKNLIGEMNWLEMECKHLLECINMDDIVADFIINAFKKNGINAERIV